MSATLTRRAWLGGALSLSASALPGCSPQEENRWSAHWVGASHERGHRLRTPAGPAGVPAFTGRAGVVVIGAGVAGLAAARGLLRAGIDDLRVFELEDAAGGNSRGHAMAGMGCPLGAHYLPTPGPHAHEVAQWLEELGLRRIEHGRVVYDERHLCHSPQERLFLDGQWHEGLLPPPQALSASERGRTLAQYRRFAQAVQGWVDEQAFRIPAARAPWTPALARLDALPFDAWLDREGLDAPALRWYLDYACRDDYGAGSAQVSAWAGLHYFASRHGFRAPGDEDDGREGVLTWPEGNGWLAARLAAPLGERLHTGCVALRIRELRGGVELELWNERAQRLERWTASHAVLALPLFVASRLVEQPAEALRAAVRAMRHAPWLVANLHCERAPIDRGGAAPAWDNVIYRSPALGYVDAMHQSLRPHPGPTVLTAYWALGGNGEAQAAAARRQLLDEDAGAWAQRVLDDLSNAHPDLPRHVRRVDLMRYGHAMCIPVPGLRGHAALRALAAPQRRLHFAHADLAGYSVFEEAFGHGTRAAADVVSAFSRAGPRSAAFSRA